MKLFKQIQKALLITPIISMPIYCVSCNKGGNIEPEPEPETNISISCESTLIHINESTTIHATITPEIERVKIQWSSSNPFVASIEDAGLSIQLHPIKTGSTFIKAEIIKDGEVIATSNEIEITIDNPFLPTSIQIDSSQESVSFGETLFFSVAKVEPATASTAVIWHSSNYEILSIDNQGIAYPVNSGTVEVWATSARDPNIASNKISIEVIGANDFETDSWETVIHYANKGYDCLEKTYSDWLSKHNNTFIGATRELNLTFGDDILGYESIPHKVRVVGVNHDYLDSTFTKKAPLTFDFVNLITLTINPLLDWVLFNLPFEMSMSTVEWINNCWIEEDGITMCYLGRKLHEIIDKDGVLPSWFENSVPYVYKQYHQTPKKEQWRFDRLFILSAKEMGDTTGDFVDEGDVYEFYSSTPSDISLYEKCLVGSDQAKRYWLRTPHATEDKVAYVEIDLGSAISSIVPNEGSFDDDLPIYVAPAFCIGRA